jgi:hypothetical protein
MIVRWSVDRMFAERRGGQFRVCGRDAVHLLLPKHRSDLISVMAPAE